MAPDQLSQNEKSSAAKFEAVKLASVSVAPPSHADHRICAELARRRLDVGKAVQDAVAGEVDEVAETGAPGEAGDAVLTTAIREHEPIIAASAREGVAVRGADEPLITSPMLWRVRGEGPATDIGDSDTAQSPLQ